MAGNEEGIRDELIAAMRDEFGVDERRIDHALRVLDYAGQIAAAEGGSSLVIQAAAILHDVGIRTAEAKHGSSAARYQELEGPPVARRIMERLGLDEETVEHVCLIVGSHHSGGDIDTIEFRIIWDADWLVNMPEMLADASPEKLERTIAEVFRTQSGLAMARRLFLDD